MNKITDLARVLKDVKSEYEREYQAAESAQKAATDVLNSDFVRGSASYKERQREIEVDFVSSIVRAQRSAAQRASDEIQSLKEFEIARVARVDTDSIEKIKAVADLPVTLEELQTLKGRFGTNYWAERCIANIGEKNGVSPQSLGISPPLDVKLSVLNQLQQQTDDLLSEYNTNVYDKNSRNARLLYLSDSSLKNAINLYNNGSIELSATDTLDRTVASISLAGGKMQQALMISRALRNAKGNSRNELLFRLVADTSISDQVYAVAGCLEEVQQWKSGLAMRYGEAVKMRENLRTAVDVNGIKTTLSSYEGKLKDGGETNPFLNDMITALAKDNRAVAEAIGATDATATDTE